MGRGDGKFEKTKKPLALYGSQRDGPAEHHWEETLFSKKSLLSCFCSRHMLLRLLVSLNGGNDLSHRSSTALCQACCFSDLFRQNDL